MARGPTVTPEVEALIAIVYEKHPEWKAPKVRREVQFILRERRGKYGAFPSGWPSLSKVQKTLATVRKNLGNPDPDDNPWSIIAIDDDHPLPAEALPTVLRLWIYKRETSGEDLTIREAKWAGRLYAITADASIGMLLMFVRLYGMNERAYELTGNRLDTMHALDLFFLSAMTNQTLAPARVEDVLDEPDLEAYRLMEEAATFDPKLPRQQDGASMVRRFMAIAQFMPVVDETSKRKKGGR